MDQKRIIMRAGYAIWRITGLIPYYVLQKRLLPKREEPKNYFAVQLLRIASILRQSMMTGSLFPSI